MKKILWTVAFAFSLIFSQAVLADSWGCGEGLKQMLTTLNLTDDQKAKLKPIMDQLKTGMTNLGPQMADLDKQINTLVSSDNMDSSALDSLVDQKAKLIGGAMKAKLMAKNQVMAILTPEQKTIIQGKLQALEDKIAAKFKSCHDQD